MEALYEKMEAWYKEYVSPGEPVKFGKRGICLRDLDYSEKDATHAFAVAGIKIFYDMDSCSSKVKHPDGTCIFSTAKQVDDITAKTVNDIVAKVNKKYNLGLRTIAEQTEYDHQRALSITKALRGRIPKAVEDQIAYSLTGHRPPKTTPPKIGEATSFASRVSAEKDELPPTQKSGRE